MSANELIQKYYIGFYGRPADPFGIHYWSDRLEEGSESPGSVLEAFADSDEARKFVFQDPDTGLDYEYPELVNNIYQNLFGRDAEEEGLDFYVDKLESGEMSLVTIVRNIMDGALDDDEPDATVLDNKLEVADYFTDMIWHGSRIYQSEHILDARAILEGQLLDVEWARSEAEELVQELPMPQFTVYVQDYAVLKGEEASITVHVNNDSDQDLEKTLDLAIWDDDDQDMFFQEVEAFFVEAGETGEYTFNFAADFGPGKYYMDAVYGDEETFYVSDLRLFNVLDSTKTLTLTTEELVGTYEAFSFEEKDLETGETFTDQDFESFEMLLYVHDNEGDYGYREINFSIDGYREYDKSKFKLIDDNTMLTYEDDGQLVSSFEFDGEQLITRFEDLHAQTEIVWNRSSLDLPDKEEILGEITGTYEAFKVVDIDLDTQETIIEDMDEFQSSLSIKDTGLLEVHSVEDGVEESQEISFEIVDSSTLVIFEEDETTVIDFELDGSTLITEQYWEEDDSRYILQIHWNEISHEVDILGVSTEYSQEGIDQV